MTHDNSTLQPTVGAINGRPSTNEARRWSGESRVAKARCDGCGVEYLAYVRLLKAWKRHFCSLECSRAARRGEANPNWRGGSIKLTCQHCGTAFERCPAQAKGRLGQYCSAPCRDKALKIHETPIDCARAARRRRDARVRAARADLPTHTEKQWADLKVRAKDRCVRCRRKVVLHRDHIIPLSKGGTDHITNIQPLCKSCNSRKYNRVETLL